MIHISDKASSMEKREVVLNHKTYLTLSRNYQWGLTPKKYIINPHQWLDLCVCVGDQTQGLMHAKQMLYHWVTSPAPNKSTSKAWKNNSGGSHNHSVFLRLKNNEDQSLFNNLIQSSQKQKNCLGPLYNREFHSTFFFHSDLDSYKIYNMESFRNFPIVSLKEVWVSPAEDMVSDFIIFQDNKHLFLGNVAM